MPYPVVNQKALDPAARQGLLGMKGKSRLLGDLPRALPHQILVYRVGDGRYRVDEAGLGPAHEDVVNANHVSVVDMTRDRPVTVEFGIPSQQAVDFRVRATFRCTVNDPIVAIREGFHDAEAALLGYLKSHPKIFQVGLEYQLRQINEVRRDVTSEILAFSIRRPPVLPGASATVASVDVETPATVAKLEAELRALADSHTLDTKKEGYSQDIDEIRRSYQNIRARTQQQHDQVMAVTDQHHKLLLRQEKNEFDRREMQEAMKLLNDDPRMALQLAFAAGELSARELARQLQEDQDRYREDEQRRNDQEVAERLARLQWDREDSLRAENRALEDQRTVRNIKVEVLRDLVSRGHLDMVNLDSLTSEILGDLSIGTAAPAAALPTATNETDPADLEEPSVREEDGD